MLDALSSRSLTTMTSKPSPLPLKDTLRDLALLRACDIDLSSVLPQDTASSQPSETDKSVDRSHEFVREARAALKLLNRGEVDEQGARVEDVRSTLEDVVRGLDAKP